MPHIEPAMSISSLRRNRFAALFLGVIVPLLEIWRRWHQLTDARLFWLWFDDVLLGSLLILGFVRAGKSRSGIAYLTAGWGFACGVIYPSLFGQLTQLHSADPSGLPSWFVVIAKAFGFLLAIWGLWSALRIANA